MSFCYDFEQPLQNTENSFFFFFFFFFFFRENIYLPYMRFLYRKSLLKSVFDQNSYLSTDFFKFCDN